MLYSPDKEGAVLEHHLLGPGTGDGAVVPGMAAQLARVLTQLPLQQPLQLPGLLRLNRRLLLKVKRLEAEQCTLCYSYT